MLRKFAIGTAFLVCAIPAICSLIWILLFVYIGAVMFYHGNGDGFFELFTRENINTVCLAAAMTILSVSALIFMRFKRLRKSR